MLPPKPVPKASSPEATPPPVPSPPPVAKTPGRYRPKMDDPAKVLKFVDKQVRKELFLAIKNGDIPLL